jgi:hypothetical protein
LERRAAAITSGTETSYWIIRLHRMVQHRYISPKL